MVLAATGHRPNKIGGYSMDNLMRLVYIAEKALEDLKPHEIICGGALGWDTAVAIATIRRNIPLTIAVPFEGQDKIWPQESKDRYQKILDKANEVVLVNEGEFAGWKMQKRNEWMVDNADEILAFFIEGSEGGTRNCIEYALGQRKNIHNYYEDV